MLPSQEVILIGFDVLGRALADGSILGRHQPDLQGIDDGPRDLILERKYVAEITVVALGPHMMPTHPVDQLRGDSNATTRLAYTPFQHMRNAQLPRRFADVHRL